MTYKVLNRLAHLQHSDRGIAQPHSERSGSDANRDKSSSASSLPLTQEDGVYAVGVIFSKCPS